MSLPSPTTARTELLEILGKSVYEAMGLLESLNDEADALNAEDSEALLRAVDVKSTRVEELQRLDRKRREVCETCGFESGPFQMEELAAWCDEDSGIMNRWGHLLEIATECNSRNLTNGSIIRIRQQHADQNLAILRGGDPAPATYVRSGDSSAFTQRAIAEA